MLCDVPYLSCCLCLWSPKFRHVWTAFPQMCYTIISWTYLADQAPNMTTARHDFHMKMWIMRIFDLLFYKLSVHINATRFCGPRGICAHAYWLLRIFCSAFYNLNILSRLCCFLSHIPLLSILFLYVARDYQVAFHYVIYVQRIIIKAHDISGEELLTPLVYYALFLRMINVSGIHGVKQFTRYRRPRFKVHIWSN